MPATQAPQQQQPMEASETINQQPTPEPQPEMSLRGGIFEECGCCGCEESCGCC